MKKIFLLLLIISYISGSEVIPYNKYEFEVDGKQIDFYDKGYIIVELSKHNGGAGNFYAVDRDGTLWLSGPISAGRPGKFKTRPGVYRINYKKRFHMSRKYPEASGINNMDYSMFFNGGIALHKGSVYSFSHGCVHVRQEDISKLFGWARTGISVIVTNEPIRGMLKTDLAMIGELNKTRY